METMKSDDGEQPVGRPCGCEGGCEHEAVAGGRLCRSCWASGCTPVPLPTGAPRRTRLTCPDSVLTERRGKFRVLCGCRWVSDWGDVEDVERDHDAHIREVLRGEV